MLKGWCLYICETWKKGGEGGEGVKIFRVFCVCVYVCVYYL